MMLLDHMDYSWHAHFEILCLCPALSAGQSLCSVSLVPTPSWLYTGGFCDVFLGPLPLSPIICGNAQNHNRSSAPVVPKFRLG